MHNEKYRKYICWGATALIVLLLLAAFVLLMLRWGRVQELFREVVRILAPVIYGAVMAYLLTPIYNRVYGYVMLRAEKLFPEKEQRRKLAGSAGTVVSLLLLVAVIVGLLSMMIPQLISSISGILEALPGALYNFQANLQNWLERILADNPTLEESIMEYYYEGVTMMQDWVKNDALPGMYRLVNSLSSSVISVFNGMVDALIGLIVMAYLLNMKDRLVVQAKMIIYSALPLKIANKVIEEFRYVHHVFGGFIIGKLVDSLIIGILSFFALNLMRMPYVLLISVIIGVTNVIPFFGPFIGAIPSAFLILLVNPLQCLYFVGFILILQQIDGNIIGPKILGDSTGLSSFWVLFSILLFGGLFGFVGMIIGVPTFAVFYKLVRELVEFLLNKRQLSADIEKYGGLDYIDEESRTYIKNKRGIYESK